MPVGTHLKHRRILTGVAGIAALTLLVAGCSSTSTAATGSSAGSVSAAGAASSGAAASGGASSGAAAEAAAAKAAVAPFLVAPTKINQSTPLTAKIPTDKPWVLITCELPQCKTISDGAEAAAKAAGVPTKLLSYKTTDGTTMTSAMKQALTYHPVAVSPIGFTQAVWNSQQAAYKAAGVIITSLSLGDNTPSDVVTQGASSQLDYASGGKTMANYVIADSTAAAHILVQDVPAFAVLKAYGDGFKAQIKSACTACTVSDLDIAPAQLSSGSLVPAVIAALRKDPSIKYLVSTDGAFLTGISTAMTAAGISGIKIMGGSPDINNLTAVKNGTQTAWTGAAENQTGWVALDIIARTLEKLPVAPADGGRVTMVITQSNVGTPSATGMSAPADYQAQYLKLWGLS